MEIQYYGNVAYLPDSGAAVSFSSPSYNAFSGNASGKDKESVKGTATALKKLVKKLNVAEWGEDNRFPQNITAQLGYVGVAGSALDFKARAIWGSGLVYGTVIEGEDGKEVFKPAVKGKFPDIDAWFEENSYFARFYVEMLQDWVYFGNCFPELVMSNNGQRIARLVHQESCDCRFQQMDDQARIQWVLLSKLWSGAEDQMVRFKANGRKESTSGTTPGEIDNVFVKQVRAIDAYDPYEDLLAAISEDKNRRNFILPVQYPSPNKTYYQLPHWDGARLSGWFEIVAKVPEMLKAIYKNAFNIKYHIEVFEGYWEKKFGAVAWKKMVDEGTAEGAIKGALKEMDNFLSGTENAHKTFISTFSFDAIKGMEINHIRIKPLDSKTNIDKELLASAAGNSEICFAMGINPDLIGAGAPGGPYSGSAGSGSNIREAFLLYCALLNIERHLLLEPLRLAHKFNGFPSEVEYRFKDLVLTTLDTGAGTKKVIS